MASVHGSLVAWKAEHFRTVDFSSSESELKQLSLSIYCALWFARMLDQLHIPRPDEFPIYADNQVAIRTMNRPQGNSKKFAHIEKYWYYNQQYLSHIDAPEDLDLDVKLKLHHRRGIHLIADLTTKSLGGPKTAELSQLGGLVNPPADIGRFFT